VLQLAKTLVQSTFADKVFFCNSGAEANEAALKLARKYAHDKFGGEKAKSSPSTMPSTAARCSPSPSAASRNIPAIMRRCRRALPICPITISRRSAAISSRTCAVIVEPIIGEGGVMPADPAFLQALRELCDRTCCLIFDEVQTGAGRTGHLYAYQHYNVVPDILTSAKGLGGGFPIGRCWRKRPGRRSSSQAPMAPPSAATRWRRPSPTPCWPIWMPAAGGRRRRHALIVDQLNALNARYDLFSAVRGKGLLIGAELASHLRGQAKTLTNLAAEEGVIALIAGPDVLRFAPALNIPLADIADAFVRLDRAVARLTR
jgi:succinylornithine aminotransferase